MRDLRRLLFYLRPHWGKFALATVAMLAVGLLSSAIGALIVPIFDQALRQNGGAGQRTPTPYGLQHYIPDSGFAAWRTIALLLIFFTVAKGVAEYFSTYLMARVGQKSVARLREDMYAHLHAQSADFFEHHRTNYLVSRLVGSAAAIETAVSNTLRDMLREGFTLVCFLVASFYYSWRLTLGALIIAPPIGFLTARFGRALRHLPLLPLLQLRPDAEALAPAQRHGAGACRRAPRLGGDGRARRDAGEEGRRRASAFA